MMNLAFRWFGGVRLSAKGVVIGAVALAFGTAQVAQAGNNPLSVVALAIDPTTPSTLYAGTGWDGVFQSTNSGGSWSAVNTGLTNTTVSVLAIDPSTPSTLYAGTNSGFFRTTNSGGSWSAVAGLGSGFYGGVLAIDPTTPSTLYAGSYDGGVFQSTNSGGSWSAVNTGLTNAMVSVLAIDPSTPSTLYAGTYDGGVFHSTNSGGGWSAVNTGLTNAMVSVLAIDPSTPSTLYAGTGSGVFQSTNGGASWTAANTGLTDSGVLALAIDPRTPSTLYAGTGDGVFQSTNSGASWTAASTGLPDYTEVYALAIDPTTPSTLYAGTTPSAALPDTGSGVFQSTNSGGSWSAVNIGLSLTLIRGLGKMPAMLEWFTEPATGVGRNGLPVHQLTCTDDDSQCDFGMTTGDNACTFHVAMCLNVVDQRGHVLWTPTDVAQVQLLSPKEAKPRGAPATANRDALENALTSMGGTVSELCTNTGPHEGQVCTADSDCDSSAGSGDGVCNRFVAFAPPLNTDNSCTAFAPIQVPLKQTTRDYKAARTTLSVKAISDPSAGDKGHNTLKLTCKPHS